MKYIQKVILIFVCVFSINALSAQYGVRGKYNLNTFSSFDEYIDQEISGNNDKIFPSSIGVGVDYWFRLKEYRVEFLPEIHIGLKSSSSFDGTHSTSFSYLGFNFNTQLYLFDLEGDCDCPTFSKQGPTLNKGLFLNVSPGVLYTTKEYNDPFIDPASTFNQLNIKLGIGIGYDIGLSDMFTITPMVSYNLVPSTSFDDLPKISGNPPSVESLSSSLKQLQFQLRFGFRPDYVKSYRR